MIKAYEKNTPLLLYGGRYIQICDIKIGDKLIGIDSMPKKVLNIFRNKSILYSVNSNENCLYNCAGAHMLNLYNIRTHEKIFMNCIKCMLLKPEQQADLRMFRVCIDFAQEHIDEDYEAVGRQIYSYSSAVKFKEWYCFMPIKDRICLIKGFISQATTFNDMFVCKLDCMLLLSKIGFILNTLGISSSIYSNSNNNNVKGVIEIHSASFVYKLVHNLSKEYKAGDITGLFPFVIKQGNYGEFVGLIIE